MGPLARVFKCWKSPGTPRPKAQAEAKPGQTKPGRRIWLAGEAFEDTDSYVFLRVGKARAQSQAQDQAQPKPAQARPGQAGGSRTLIYLCFYVSEKPMKTIARCFHMPGAPQEPPEHRSIRVFTCRRRPGTSPDPSPGPAQAKPEQARPGSNLVGPSHARPSPKAKAQDDNPREGCSQSAFWTYVTNILKMCTHAQDTCFHVPMTPTISPGC